MPENSWLVADDISVQLNLISPAWEFHARGHMTNSPKVAMGA